MRSFKCFDKIIIDNKIYLEQLQTLDKIYAHINEGKENETLYEHTNKVLKYFFGLINAHKLEKIIDELITSISFDEQVIAEYIKKLFVNSIIFHDFGKVNVNFQIDKLKNTNFCKDFNIRIGTEHSFLSAYIFLSQHLNEIYQSLLTSDINRNILACHSFLFTIPILKHHSSWLQKDYNYEIEKINSIHYLIKIFNIEVDEKFINQFIKNENKLWEYFDYYAQTKSYNYFSLYALLKLNWSLMTAADFYATSEYMNDLKVDDFGLIDEKLRKTIFENFITCKSYNRELLEKPQDYLKLYPEKLSKSPESLNMLRQRLGAEVWVNLEKYKDEYVFYIEAPTGGGKTNLSMIAIRKLLELHPEINKVFYVFPFTTLITQTFKAIKETMGLTEEHIAQVHSKADFQQKEYEDDAQYGEQLKNQIDNLFVNYPFTLLTHIKFFDILKSNDKKSNYLLHRLANSVVIIDELQTYNPKHWDKVKYFISNYAKYFNIRFVLMSATLPKLHNIEVSENELLKFNDLIENAQENYLQNTNFSKRITIKPDLLDKKGISLEQLAEIVYEKSENFAINRTDKYKNSVHTIIEFIFKKTATEFYNIITEKALFTGYEIFVLSGTILEPQRKYIIEYLKDKENRDKKVLLITTQVVEAGVDIDMDLGFKNQSLIDSDEQLAGRINRNVEKEGCELWLFKYNEPSKIYSGDLRYKVASKLESKEIEHILQEKDFHILYQKVMEKINTNNESVYKSNFDDYSKHIASLRFNNINSEFKLIESDTVAIFVPANIPVTCYKNELNFSKDELKFLERKKIIKTVDDYVSGEDIWNIYISLINNKQFNFLNKETDLKLLNSIMSKFVFSVFKSNIDAMKPYFDYHEDFKDYRVYQYLKLKMSCIGADNVYSLERGLDEKKIKVSYEFI